ncbi:cadmium transporter [Planosporangium mesophilum]|uniref:Cadmium transporter n=1 Tax=Planosporangium mesophilum TaxID=689768 RepID=A0A8J3TAW3_9ACTN|nr:cadmium transporter [Planosporangium mesophilum]
MPAGSLLAVDHLLGTVGTAVGVFAGTNVDDLIVLTVLFLSSRASGRPKGWQIWAGQYAGIGVLVAVSVLTALGLTIVPDRWVGLLGLMPLGLGVRGLVKAIRAHGDGEQSNPAVATGLLSIAGVTIANGSDNVSVYTPIFRTAGPGATGGTVAVFAVLVAVWCLAGSWLGSHKKVIEVVERLGHWIVPAVFMLIGGLIVVGSGVIGRVLSLG